MNKKVIGLLLISTLFMAGCNQNKSGAPQIDKSDAVAEVNGQYISKASLESLQQQVAQRSPGVAMPDDKLIDELITRELLYQEAIKDKLDQSPEVAAQLQSIKMAMLSQATLQEYIKNNPVSDEELKAQYDKDMGSNTGTEYKARHILLKTEPEAVAIIVELDKGSDFAKLAKSKSTGPSAPQGGDLGWFAAGQMVPPFSEAVIALENGKYTTEPVKTQFGWHVILREDSREQSLPPFDSVKEQIRPVVQREKIQAYIEGLRSAAKIEILTAPVVVEEEIDVVEGETDSGEEVIVVDEQTDSGEEVIVVEETEEAPSDPSVKK